MAGFDSNHKLNWEQLTPSLQEIILRKLPSWSDYSTDVKKNIDDGDEDVKRYAKEMADSTRKKVDEDYDTLEKYVKDQDSKLMEYSDKNRQDLLKLIKDIQGWIESHPPKSPGLTGGLISNFQDGQTIKIDSVKKEFYGDNYIHCVKVVADDKDTETMVKYQNQKMKFEDARVYDLKNDALWICDAQAIWASVPLHEHLRNRVFLYNYITGKLYYYSYWNKYVLIQTNPTDIATGTGFTTSKQFLAGGIKWDEL